MDVDWDHVSALCTAAIESAGGDAETASALTDAVVTAERWGNSAVGVAHLFDYLDALRGGRLNGSARPTISHDHVSVIMAWADDGLAQAAFRAAEPDLIEAARTTGVAVLSISDAFTAGELGYYTRSLAEHGLLALAAANSPALMSLYGVPAAVTGTNPFSFAVPATPTPRLVDQASSVTAWVRIRDAAAAGKSIPAGWALDADGNDTTDAAAAMLGPLLPFGGVKGSNLAVVIELLAVLSGASFSLDAPDITTGSRPPRVGAFILVLDPAAFGSDYLVRVDRHFQRLQTDYGIDFGRFAQPVTQLQIPDHLYDQLVAAASPHQAS